MDFTFLDKMRKGKMAGPAWLSHLASNAQVEVTCLSVMNSLIAPEHGGPGLKDLIDNIIGRHMKMPRLLTSSHCLVGCSTCA